MKCSRCEVQIIPEDREVLCGLCAEGSKRVGRLGAETMNVGGHEVAMPPPEVVVHGTCKLKSGDATAEQLGDCIVAVHERLTYVRGTNDALTKTCEKLVREGAEQAEQFEKVKREIIHFRDHQGCNPGRRKLAMRRLLWSVGEDYG